jgi:UDP-N-acetylmuramoylalanine--D-glutamate ligase
MNIALIGFRVEGRASYGYFTNLGHTVTICDQDEATAIPDGTEAQLGEGYLHDLNRFDLIVRSAGIHPGILLAENPGIEHKITTAVNEFMAVCPTKNVIGVTGTKGKGTTSTLIAKMLKAAGKRVYLGGNIGRSPLEFINELTPDDWVVLELSSFQLSDIKHSPHIGVCLMVVPEHLNWHTDMDDYKHAKANMFRFQSADDIAIYNAENGNSYDIAEASAGHKVPYLEAPGAYVSDTTIMVDKTTICDVSELQLLGKHNWENICAAITAVWQVAPNAAAIRSVATTFSGLPHRLEYVREANEIRYYNDSFAATPDAAIAAMAAIAGPKVMIMGGFDRQLPIEHLAKAVHDNPDHPKILLIGQSAQRVAQTLRAAGYDNYALSKATTMSEIAAEATRLAEPNGAVILSPGFASFDMFKNFEDRGDQFKSAVEAL